MKRYIKSETDDFIKRAVSFGQRNGLNIPELALAFSDGRRCSHEDYLKLCKWFKNQENVDRYYSGVELASSRRPIKSAFTPDEKHSIGNIDFYDVEGSRDREGNTFSCGGDLGDCWADSAWYDCDTKQLHFGNAYFNSHRDMTDEDAKDYFSETISYYLDDGFNGDELVHDFCEALYSSRQIKSARYIATDPESGEVLGSADTYEEAVNEWGEDVTITDSEAAEEKELFQSRRAIKSAVDGGWRVDASDVPEALDLYVEYVGEENALESIARAMSSDTLKENIEWIAQQWGFGEDLEEYDDSWDMYEYAKEVMGESELFNNLTQAAGYDELAEDLAYIFRMEDFREWDKYDEPEEDEEYEDEEEIESSFNSKHLMSRFAALSDEGQEYVLSQMNCDNEEELEDKIYSYADFYSNRNAQRLISNAEREVYDNIDSTPRSIVSSILNGTLTEEKAVQQIANKYDCNNGYARKLLNSWIDENKEDLIASGVIVNDYNKAFDRDGNLDSWYNDYVPEYGPANTVGGELVRAFQNMDIAYYNNGDMIGSGYGKQTVNPSARYILENARIPANRQINNWLTNRSKATPDKYLNFLESARTELEDFLRNNEELFHTPNNSFIGSAAEEDDMRIKECYLSDSEGNKYFLTKTGDNEWKCTDVEFSIDAQTWEEGDTFTDSDDSELDPTDEFGSFEKDGITYEWEAADDPDEDGNHHEWKITSVNVANQFCSKGDVFSDDDLDPDNLEYGFALYDTDGNEITEREFLASSLGRVYSAYVVGKGKVGIELNLNGWKTINIDGKPTGGTPVEFKNETEAMKSDIYTSLVDRYGEDKVRTFRQN